MDQVPWRNVLMSGASGLIGTATAEHFRSAGHHVRTLVRNRGQSTDQWAWDPAHGEIPAEAIEWADIVINFAGSPLAKLPWTQSRKDTILSSRVDTTKTIANAIATSVSPPAVWLNASAVGFYGNRPDERLTEESVQGEGFLADVVGSWEAATRPAESATRVVQFRTGIVLAQSGALRPIILTTKLGLGTRFGSGAQHWPWISLEDEVRALHHLATSSALDGPVNLAAPAPATCEQITREVARQLNRPHLLVAPAPLLKLVMGGAADELLLADQLVLPRRLDQDGFRFLQAQVEEGVASALGSP